MTPRLISGWPNSGGVGSQNEIAHHGQLAAAAEGEAGHCGNHRLPDPQHRLPALADEILQQGGGMGAILHFLDVGAGGEGFFVSGQNDGADCRVVVERQELIADLLHHGIAQCIQHSGRFSRISPTRPWVSTTMFSNPSAI